ncbi:MAG: inositol monophosphatase [Planctomycetota bacterium]|nr:MAG: inositol monophosphatase [Planctomycetota bacterium]
MLEADAGRDRAVPRRAAAVTDAPSHGSVPRLDLERARNVALAAARAAGAIHLRYLGEIAREGITRKSSARDLVTRADVEAERAIVAAIRAAFPDHAIEAEEEVRDAADGRPRWFVDPLDGTTNFVHELPAFCASIALYADGAPQVAVVHAPRFSETFHATRGGGAWLETAHFGAGAARRLSVSAASALSESVVATGFPYKRNEMRAQGIEDNLGNFSRVFYEVRGLRRMGSAAIDLAYVAAGRFDAFWELHLSPHDVAAGALLVQEAGGEVTDVGGGAEWLRGGSIVAGPRVLCQALRPRLRR